MGQHAAGHLDFVIPRKVLNGFERRVIDGRQTLAKLGSGPSFNAGDQQTKHIVKNLDLILVEPFPFMQEEVCHLAKRLDPLFLRAILNGVFEFVDDGMIKLLQDVPHASLLFLFRPAFGRGQARLGNSASVLTLG